MSGSDGTQIPEQVVESEPRKTSLSVFVEDAERVRLLKRDLKRTLKIKSQPAVIKHLLDFYEGKVSKPEESSDGVHVG